MVVLTLEAATLAKGKEGDQFAQPLKDNVFTYEYEKHSRNRLVRAIAECW